MAHKLPKGTKLYWSTETHKWTLSDDTSYMPVPLAVGTAVSRIQARQLAWEACEEMGLVTDGE